MSPPVQKRHQISERGLNTFGMSSVTFFQNRPSFLLIIPHPALSPEGDIVPPVDKLGVFTHQDVGVVREVLADTEAFKSIGHKVFQVWDLVEIALVNDDGISGQAVDAVTDGSR